MTLYISPYRRLASLRDTMDRLLDESLSESSPREREMVLAVDVLSDDEAYTISALVPGLQADDLNIEILNNTVTIRGEFTSEVAEGAQYVTCELPEGRFNRVITLPAPVDASKAEANIKNGVLQLRIPKAESHRPRSIKINAG